MYGHTSHVHTHANICMGISLFSSTRSFPLTNTRTNLWLMPLQLDGIAYFFGRHPHTHTHVIKTFLCGANFMNSLATPATPPAPFWLCVHLPVVSRSAGIKLLAQLVWAWLWLLLAVGCQLSAACMGLVVGACGRVCCGFHYRVRASFCPWIKLSKINCVAAGAKSVRIVAAFVCLLFW